MKEMADRLDIQEYRTYRGNSDRAGDLLTGTRFAADTPKPLTIRSHSFETRLLPSALAATHRGFAFYVALPKSSIETCLLPSSLAATHHGFAFYVAFPKRSIETRSLPSSLAAIPAAPFASRQPLLHRCAELMHHKPLMMRPKSSFADAIAGAGNGSRV